MEEPITQLLQAIAEGGASVCLLALVLFGGYKLASRWMDKWIAAMDAVVAKLGKVETIVDRMDTKLDVVIEDVGKIRERTDRHASIR